MVVFCRTRESVSDSFEYFYIEGSEKHQGVCSDLDSLFEGNMIIYCFKSDFSALLRHIQNNDFKLKNICSEFELPTDWDLYDIFSRFYESDIDLTDSDMIYALLYLLNSIKTQSYCFVLERGKKLSLCWFRLNDNRLDVRGNLSLDIVNESYSSYKFGKFKKYLSYKMYESDCCISNTKFYLWSYNENSISRWLPNYESISSLLSFIPNFNKLSYLDIFRFLSSKLKFTYEFSAVDFTELFSVLVKELGVDENLNLLSTFKKDYSRCTCNDFEKSRGKWGIILDCEGNKDNALGLRELGGVIFCRYNGIAVCVESFFCNEVLLEETLIQVIKNYETDTERYIPSRGIDVFTFGSCDEVMIEDSLRRVGTKQFRRRLKRVFRFHDCRGFIDNFLDSSDVVINRRDLSSIALTLGVCVVSPKHNALADSKTLFNVLTHIYINTGDWASS